MSTNPVIKDDNLVLRTSALQSAGAAANTGIAAGPCGAVKAVIIVSVVASGGTLDVHLESSSDNAASDAYADISHSAFTQITATGIYEQIVTLPEKWVRAYGTVGTNDVTWEMFLTTIEK